MAPLATAPLKVDIMNLKWMFIYLGQCPSPSPLFSPDVNIIDLKLSNVTPLG